VLAEWAKIANPEHPSETRGWGLAALSIVLFTLAFMTVCARLWARFLVRHTAGIDDVLIVLATIFTAGLALSTALGSRFYGFDRHAYDLTPAMAIDSRKITLAMEATYMASTGLTKISILFFYRRMSNGTVSNVFRTIVFASIASVAAYMIAFLLVGSLGCNPLSAFWQQADVQWAATHPAGQAYHCVNEAAVLLTASGVSILQDFLTCGLPLLLFWKLQLPQQQKIALAAIFGIGFFLCITGCLRMYYIQKIFFTTYDITWAAYDVWIWTVVEAHLAIICASAPALKIFVQRYLSTFSLTGTASQRKYSRKAGYSGQNSLAYGTTSTANLDGPHQGGEEMRGISVTKAVDIEPKNMSETERKMSDEQSLSDEERVYGVPEPKSTSSWLYIDPPTPNARV
jgi:hypothetical protein